MTNYSHSKQLIYVPKINPSKNKDDLRTIINGRDSYETILMHNIQKLFFKQYIMDYVQLNAKSFSTGNTSGRLCLVDYVENKNIESASSDLGCTYSFKSQTAACDDVRF